METNTNSPLQSPLLQSHESFYDPAGASRIASVLCELLNPAYILLFGRCAGLTPHSDTLAYDLLVITEGIAPYDWYAAKRYLKMKLPQIGHGVPYMNIYVHSRHDVEANVTPFFYLARREGVVLYRSHRQRFTRPNGNFDFGRAASVAAGYAGVFLPQDDRLTDWAQRRLRPEYVREAAFATAQAAIYYYRTLFYVYHGFDAGSCDVRYLHHRLRTLSGELLLLFESDEYRPVTTLHKLKRIRDHVLYDPGFFVGIDELSDHLGRIKRLGEVVTRLCDSRVALYAGRA